MIEEDENPFEDESRSFFTRKDVKKGGKIEANGLHNRTSFFD